MDGIADERTFGRRCGVDVNADAWYFSFQGAELAILTGAKVAIVVVTPRGVRHEWLSTADGDKQWASVTGSTNPPTSGSHSSRSLQRPQESSQPINVADMARTGSYAPVASETVQQ